MSFVKIRSNRGGISTVIAEIMLGAIIISLLITVIMPSFKNSRELISIAAEKENRLSNINSIEGIVIGKEFFTGNDVIAAVRYYGRYENIMVTVTTKTGNHIYLHESYDENIFNIPRNDTYIISLIYEGNTIKSVEFTFEA